MKMASTSNSAHMATSSLASWRLWESPNKSLEDRSVATEGGSTRKKAVVSGRELDLHVGLERLSSCRSMQPRTALDTLSNELLVSSNNKMSPLPAAVHLFIAWIIDKNIQTCPHQ